jgi:hypothetical protein
LACAASPCGDDGGITLLEREGPRTAVATSETALEVDNAQYDTEQGGPCLEAYQQQQIFRIESTADEARWPVHDRPSLSCAQGWAVSWRWQ